MRFIAGVEPALTDIEKTIEGLIAERGEVIGLLRIDAPRLVLDMALTPILARLAQQHPRLTIEVRTGQTSVDIVAQGFDAGIRIRRAIQQDMVTTRLTGSFKVGLVASMDYLDVRGTPRSIADLHQHNCIGIRSVVSGAVFDWELMEGKKPRRASPAPSQVAAAECGGSSRDMMSPSKKAYARRSKNERTWPGHAGDGSESKACLTPPDWCSSTRPPPAPIWCGSGAVASAANGWSDTSHRGIGRPSLW